jgi:hypothetical protein
LDPAGLAGTHYFLRQFYMGTVKAVAVMAFFVEDAYQVDHHIAAAEGRLQRLLILYVGFLQLQCGEDQQVAMTFTSSGDNLHMMSIPHKPGCNVVTNKTATAKNTNPVLCHDR